MSDVVMRRNMPDETLINALDALLDTGAVIDGHLVISVAGVDLVFIGLRALLASIDSAARLIGPSCARVAP